MDRSNRMFKKILVLLDGSEIAEVALPYAEDMAVRFDSELTLLHTHESMADPYYHMYQAYFENIVVNTRYDAEQYFQKDKEVLN